MVYYFVAPLLLLLALSSGAAAHEEHDASNSCPQTDDCLRRLAATEQSKSSLLEELRQQQEEVSSLKLSHAEDAASITVMQGQVSQLHAAKTAEIQALASEKTACLAAVEGGKSALLQAQQASKATQKALEASAEESKSALAKALKDSEAAQQALKVSVDETKSALAKALKDSEAAQKQSVSRLKQAEAKIKELEARLQAAEADKTPLNFTELWSALAISVSQQASFVGREIAAVYKELAAGDTTKLVQSAQKVHAWATASARSAFDFAAQQLDQHLPLARQHVAEALAKVEAVYKTHVAAWVDEVTHQLSTANAELKAFISAKLASHPALAPLDDPVYVQLAAYAIICAPLLLLFLPVLLWLATALAPAPKNGDVSKSSKKKKKDAAKPAKAVHKPKA